MSVHERRQRERAERERLIVTAARELAEAEGWDAVTTRRLAERVEYSQPVLYGHFANMDAIRAAVAMEGFAELADRLRAARAGADGPGRALAAVAQAYCAFAEQRPALYDVMFSQSVSLAFAVPQTPAPMRAGFDELRHVVQPVAGTQDAGLLTEVLWSALHGLVTLTRSGRLPPAAHAQRLSLLVGRFTG